jgi:hypothetical protein
MRATIPIAFAMLVAGCTESYFYIDTVAMNDGEPGTASFTVSTPTATTNVTVRNGILMAGPTIPDLYNGKEEQEAKTDEEDQEAEIDEEVEGDEVSEAEEAEEAEEGDGE